MKKIISFIMILVMTVSMTACGTREYSSQLKKDQKAYGSYVTLGQYKGIEYTVDKSGMEVKNEAIQEVIDNILKNEGEKTEITEGTTKDGDEIVMDYAGYLDGVAFSGGTATDYPYTIGSHMLIEDLEKGLIGLDLGTEYEIPCKFPEDYQNIDELAGKELAGKDVIFNVTVNAIVETEPAEYTDALVQEIASGYNSDATTVDEFNAYIKEVLQKDAESNYEYEKQNQIVTKVLENCTISEYPQKEWDSITEILKRNMEIEFQKTGPSSGITNFASYLLSAYGFSSVDEFNEQAVEYARQSLKEKMVYIMIAKQENITVSKEELLNMGQELAEYYEYESYENMIEALGKDAEMEVGYAALSEKVLDFLIENAVEK